MSKKRAVDYTLSYVHQRSRPQYVSIEFQDKKNRNMRSSVDVLYHTGYLVDENGDWDLKKLRGFMLTR